MSVEMRAVLEAASSLLLLLLICLLLVQPHLRLKLRHSTQSDHPEKSLVEASTDRVDLRCQLSCRHSTDDRQSSNPQLRKTC